MPQVFKIGSYWVYFWSNENEPLEGIIVRKKDSHLLIKVNDCLSLENKTGDTGKVLGFLFPFS